MIKLLRKKKWLVLLLVCTIIQACTAQNNSSTNSETLSLNGNWKFNTIAGQGYNYMNVKSEPTDIVIDNKDKNQLEIKGDWKTKSWGARQTHPYNGDYLQLNFGRNESKDKYVRFLPNIKEDGYYEVFVWFPFESNMTVQYKIKHSEGIKTVYWNERTFCNEWLSSGIYKFNAKDKNYVEVTADSDLSVAADAIMFKPVAKSLYDESKSLPNEVYKKDFDDNNWSDLKVPGHWGMLNKYSNYTGLGWYRKTFTWPKQWKVNANDKFWLKFGGVYHVAKVYVNGKFVGQNQGGFTPFEFDITDFLLPDQENVIAVEANNGFIVSATWNWGGIIRGVEISKTKDIRIKNQYFHADPDLKKGTAEVQVRVTLENNANTTKSVSINSSIIRKGVLASLAKSVEVPANTTKDFVLKTKLENVALWHFDHPNLYEGKTTLTLDNNIIDTQQDNFGIRKVEITNTQLFLNGEPVRIGGFNRVSESRYWGSSEPLHVLEEDVDLMKEAGANFMRIMHGTQSEQLIELCDKKGILLFEEVNVRDLNNVEFTAPDFPRAKQWITGMIERDLNHPSIIGWSVGNELSYHYDYGKTMMEYVKKELDPYRFVTCVSNSGQKEEYTPKTDPNTFTDILMHNMYPWQGKPQEILNTLRKKWPNKPIFISEYGLVPIKSTSLDEDLPQLSEWLKYYKGKNNFVIGTSLWTFNDYRSGYAGTTAEENRVWGLVSVWRQKRKLFYRLRRENSPLEKLALENINFDNNTAKVEVAIKKADDYPSFALKNYKLKYVFSDANGKVILEKEVDLPYLKPGDKSWKSKLSWEKLSTKALDLKIDLVNPIGYSRHTETYAFEVPNTPQISSITSGNTVLRVHFNKVYGAEAYSAKYTNDDGEVVVTSPTINPFIDIKELSNRKKYSVEIIAINGKGKSNVSNSVSATPKNVALPPAIWKSFITGNKLVVGYSSDFNDGIYSVAYGTSKNKLIKEFSTDTRGMMSIDLEGDTPIYIKIKRSVNGKESPWSKIYTISDLNPLLLK